MDKQYWQSLEDYRETKTKSDFSKKAEPEFSIEGLDESEIKAKSSRRDFSFLVLGGFHRNFFIKASLTFIFLS